MKAITTPRSQSRESRTGWDQPKRLEKANSYHSQLSSILGRPLLITLAAFALQGCATPGARASRQSAEVGQKSATRYWENNLAAKPQPGIPLVQVLF